MARSAVASTRRGADEVAASLHGNLGSNAALAIGSLPWHHRHAWPASRRAIRCSIGCNPAPSSTVLCCPTWSFLALSQKCVSPVGVKPAQKISKRVSLKTESASAAVSPCLPEAAVYARELLKIRVSVAAVLADKRLPVGRVLHITPGTILKFGKSCDQPIELEVGGHRIASGEAVTIGERFGLQITSLNKMVQRDWTPCFAAVQE